MTNMKMISPIKADEDVGGGKDNDTNQRLWRHPEAKIAGEIIRVAEIERLL
uniref:Uncharacterized protein n=2 Tax=Oryza TaxID=4527 RepID=Q2R3Q3_ORYSJ|nr:hypothetical protein LOC_Os11g31150 [Oryza sativa Japonica Group]